MPAPVPGPPPSQPGLPPLAPGSQPRLPTAAPYGPAPNPYQSQIVPPNAFVGPVYPKPPLPATQPHGRRERGGTMPAIALTPQMPHVSPVVPSAQSSRPNTPGPLPVNAFTRSSNGIALPRIMVQYPQIGSKLTGMRGTYEVRDVIGAGEFGAVYECIGPFDQIYAVKMVRPSNRPYSEVHAEWAREVQRLFSLRHPNVVYIYDSFAHDHLFYLALERCDHPLKVMLGTPMQEGLVIEMSRQLLAAVQFLHDNDVVHDDLHAGNVLITHTDRPTVKISDFGISHELRGMAAVRPNIVHHAIMAPEILATGYTSRQSDLYQVGLLIYWMLTGEPAMKMDVPYQELVRQVADGEPRQRAEALGIPLGDLIAKMLRRREAFRYTSAREVWEDMRELPEWKQRDLFPAK
jgi:eukaryotic-like serine/threonine-protein kinase